MLKDALADTLGTHVQGDLSYRRQILRAGVYLVVDSAYLMG